MKKQLFLVFIIAFISQCAKEPNHSGNNQIRFKETINLNGAHYVFKSDKETELYYSHINYDSVFGYLITKEYEQTFLERRSNDLPYDYYEGVGLYFELVTIEGSNDSSVLNVKGPYNCFYILSENYITNN